MYPKSLVAAIRTRRPPDQKFKKSSTTADGYPRATVRFEGLEALWFNTGTVCNLTCGNCYIESSPKNDRLAYLTLADIRGFLDEISYEGWPTKEVGFTGGEPFMNPHFIEILDEVLCRGFQVLILTNAMRPMMKRADALLRLLDDYGSRLSLRVSVDHYTNDLHSVERGHHSWKATISGLVWLFRSGFEISVAGRTCWKEEEASLRAGYAALFDQLGLDLEAANPNQLILFPEMDKKADVPEITNDCWEVLGIRPDAMMCATSRMVVKRRGAQTPRVVSCTLMPYDPGFEMGSSLKQATGAVLLNHPHCSRFCVLGGATCGSAGGDKILPT